MHVGLIITRSGRCLASSAQSTTCGKVTLAGLRGSPLGRGVEGVPASYTTALFLIAAPSSLPQAAFPFFSISATAVCRASHHTALGPVQMQSAVLPVSSHQALPGLPCAQGKEKKKGRDLHYFRAEAWETYCRRSQSSNCLSK